MMLLCTSWISVILLPLRSFLLRQRLFVIFNNLVFRYLGLFLSRVIGSPELYPSRAPIVPTNGRLVVCLLLLVTTLIILLRDDLWQQL